MSRKNELIHKHLNLFISIMNNTKYWIALSVIKGIGPAVLKEVYSGLTSKKLTMADLFDLKKIEIEEELSFNEKIADAVISAKEKITKTEEDYFKIIDSGINVITFFSDLYPVRLHELLENSIPPFLYAYGNSSLLSKKSIAMLGEKKISEKGEVIAYLGAKDLVSHHIPVIGGMAGGAGLIAHRSALENGGETIAVLPYGINHLIVPKIISEISDQERILFLSPFYPTLEADQYSAFKRNKIIAALSYAVFIVEAPESGGIFEAAKSAHSIGVPLFTAEYSEYPVSAAGNKKILDELGGIPVRGRLVNNSLAPNMDKIIGCAKFG